MADLDNQIGVYLTLETVFPNEKPSLDFLKLLLQQLNKSDVILASSRLNLYISDRLLDGSGTWLERHLRKQLEATATFFNPDQLPKIEAFVRQHPHCSIFFGGQLLELIRWAALYCRDGEPTDELITNSGKRNMLAQALLTVSSLWDKRVYRNQLASGGDLTATRFRLLARFRRSISETEKGPDLTQAFVRGRAIIVEYLCRSYPEFPDRFRENAGLTLDEYYWCLLFIILTSIGMWGNTAGAPPIAALRVFKPVSDNPELQKALIRIMELRSQSVAELTAALWEGKGDPTESDFATLEHKVFRDRPILRLRDGHAIVMDPIFLRDMLSTGPLFLSGDTDRSLREFGHAFEGYCRDVLAAMYPDAPGLASRLAPSTLGKRASGSEVQVADGILDCGDKTVMIETKASLIRDDKIDSFEPADYIEFLRSKYGVSSEGDGGGRRKGVAQLANTISKLGSGEWTQADSAYPVREHIVPALLVHDTLIDAPLHPWFLAREFATLIEASNADLSAPTMRAGRYLTSNLIVMTIDDLEALESSVQTFGLCDLLQDYDANCRDRMLSLHNYIVEDRKYGNAIVYSERIRRIFSKALEDLRRRLEQGRQEGDP